MKRTKLLAVVIGACLVLTLVALPFMLGYFEEEAVAAPAQDNTWEWPKKLKIITGGMGTLRYSTTVAWAGVLEKMTGMKVRVTPCENSVEQNTLIKHGAGDLSVDADISIIDVVMGTGASATQMGGPYEFRLVWTHSRMPFGWAVRGDSDIKTFADLQPKVAGPRKFGVWVASPPMSVDMYAFIDWLGLDKENKDECIIVPFGSYAVYVRALSEGKADVIYASPYSPATYEAEASPAGLRWLPVPTDDPEGEARFRKHKPITTFAEPTIGVESARGVRMAQGLVFYFTRAEQDTELVYHLSKWFHEAYDQYKKKDPVLFQMSLEELKKYHLPNALFPWHDGAIRYFKEVGVWTAKDDARQAKNVDIMNQWVQAYNAAQDAAHEKKIKIDPKSEEWQKHWATYNKDLPRYEFY